MFPEAGPSSAETVSRLLSVLAVLAGSVAAVVLLAPNPLADVFFAGWVLFSVALTVVGGLAAWSGRTPLLWAAAIMLTGLSILGMWSIGFFIAPAAVFLLGSALFSQLAGPREGLREEIIAQPPTVTEAALKALAGVGSMVIGSGLVYMGAFARELFSACARETLECALANAHWDAIGMTLVGVSGIGLGGWLLWKQLYIAGVLTSRHAG